jgi:hypothetical protein
LAYSFASSSHSLEAWQFVLVRLAASRPTTFEEVAGE